MKILVACEFSGVVRNAFIAKWHDAWSCDYCSGREPNSSRHIRGDVRPLLRKRWDLVIAHPPCTFLTNTGVCWLKNNLQRQREMREACQFFIGRLLMKGLVGRWPSSGESLIDESRSGRMVGVERGH